MGKSNARRHDIRRLDFQFLNVNLGKNLGIDLEKFCGTGPSTRGTLLLSHSDNLADVDIRIRILWAISLGPY